MGVLRRRSRVGDTAKVAAAQLERGLHDVLDAVTGTAEDLADRAATQVGATVTAARRDLADRIDPAPVPRRGLRLIVLGLLVTTVSAVVWALLARRSAAAPPHGSPEHLPSTVAADNLAETPAEDAAADEPPVTGLTGDPESGPS
ncbi:MAG: hypothetical protein QOK35_415 [Pseudonocardiales bacterium]|nr:hypothetical protein [Pseudonocardiales bacterium]